MTFAESSLHCTLLPAWITLFILDTCLLRSQDVYKETALSMLNEYKKLANIFA